MKKRRTPREKKELSYKHDHRDTYNESNKGSRKRVRFRKRQVNQVYRQRIRQALHGAEQQTNDNADDVTNRVLEARRPQWKKSSHTPLGLVLLQKRKIDPQKLQKLTFRVRDPDPLRLHYAVCKSGSTRILTADDVVHFKLAPDTPVGVPVEVYEERDYIGSPVLRYVGHRPPGASD
jgi:hypothetical protein